MANDTATLKRLLKELERTARIEKQLLWLYGQQNKILTEKYISLLSKYLENGKFIKILNKNHRDKDVNLMLQEMKVVTQHLTTQSTKLTTALLVSEYTRVAIETYKDLGMRAPTFLYDKDYVRRMVEANFKDGKTFSERIWGNTARMEEKLQSTLNEALISGEGIPTTVRKFSNITGQGYNEVRRVIRTETVATYTRASLDTYRALGIKEVRILDGQDGRCEECASWNNSIVKIEDASIGQTVPPRHPNCRGTIVPVLNEG